ncbi:hypothetical protein [Aureibacter tunicatorum]|uniref:Regulation of enolase protein 1 (Concanavalin A-like superfamily) n=1 Tax=Aureibacter tunicatorum TaxID=866807 RepID=A0AAE3XRM8_9BACT|nr:hypothetical protein [Aureibacter tunicatorum]MDR6240764.1 regulation of enolase protein 1 (concanavalin A-like superfamily) [Aureibacter tunicatorum]BDD06903.1 hypothetical protein AUTU_43860 [Aureibacter tunicatorum]
MELLLICALVGLAVIFKGSDRQLKYGKFTRKASVIKNGRAYYIEEAEFESYNDALHYYFKSVEDYVAEENPLDSSFDYYDWSFTILKFKMNIIEIRLFRSYKKIQFIRSEEQVDIENYLRDNPSLSVM